MNPSATLLRRDFGGAMLAAVIATMLASAMPPVLAQAVMQPVARPQSSMPVTAVSFPKEVVPVAGGRIEFWAKLHKGYGGGISVGGSDPHFFQVYDGTSAYHMGFNSNDGSGNGGLVGVAGDEFYCGTGGSGGYTYEGIYGAGNVSKWHYYSYQWDSDGALGPQHVYIYVDGVLNTASWFNRNSQTFPPLTSGTFNLITTAGPLTSSGGPVQMQDLKIFDRDGTLVLYNTLGSKKEVEHSVVGLDGSFNGGGGAHFIAAGHAGGHALAAIPVGGIGPF